MGKINLIKVELSKINLYPEEMLYIVCTFQAKEDSPINEEVQLFADFHFGHMTIDAGAAKYYRVVADMYPQPVQYKKGEVWSSTIRWKVPKGQWGGAFGVHIGMMNSETQPVSFNLNGDEYNTYHVDDINIVFEGVAEKFMQEHSGGKIYIFDEDNIIPEQFNHNFDATIAVRDVKTDRELKLYGSVEPNKRICNDYVSFIMKKDENEYVIDDVEEKDGYEFLYVKLPLMFTQDKSRMITMYGEGRIINPENSYPWGYEQVYFIRNVAILANGEKNILIETPFLDEKLHQSVCELNGERFCSVGVTMTYRVRAFENFESVKVINKPTVKFWGIGGDWKNCLPKMREGITKKTDMYDRCVFYYYGICAGPGRPVRTFRQALEYVKRVYKLTGGVKQYILLCGWQHEGHDTGYPDVFTLNEKAGTMEDLIYCVEEAKKYNACITFHDNYDDLYELNGFFDSEIAATDANGTYYSSWIWTAGVSIMTSFPKYFKTGKMQERVKKTVDMLPIDKSYHIDVLSQEVRRYDFAPEVKMAAQEVLEYKLKVIEEFEKYGIAVTSEGITHPFAGRMGYAWRLNSSKGKLFCDEEIIPLTGMIYHGLVPYSSAGNTAVIFGGNSVPGNLEDEAAEQKTFFEKTLPIGLLCNELMEDYSFRDGVHTIIYTNNSSVVFDEVNDTVAVKYKGEYLTKDGTTCASGFNKNEYLCYSENGSFNIKNRFEKNILKVTDLSGKEMEYQSGDYIAVKTNANTAFKIILED